jgi:putative polyketide hydroxylase
MTSHTSVLIAGGSLNGLTTALLLAHRHVPCIVVERHAKTSLQYKFRGISPRSMEIYRSLGLEDEIRRCDPIDKQVAHIARMKNLSDEAITWQGIPWGDSSEIGPTGAAVCDQDQLEPILKRHAEALGADIRFHTELVSFAQDTHGVTARIRQRGDGSESTIRADYLIAADGTHGTVRDALGITRHGPGVLQHWMNIIFDTDLEPTLDGRSIRSVFVTDINGTFVPRAGGRWLMAVQYVPERGERPEDFTNERCVELIQLGAGRPDVKAEIVDARPWDAAALVADRYREGRAFLVGDTAHVMPPTGGFGGNTGIHDAYNIAWKLEAVLERRAGDRLLDTHDLERRPVAERTMAQALARLQAWFKDPSGRLPPPEPIVDDYQVIFGYRYREGALIPEPPIPPGAFEDPRQPSGRPGSRAPQLIVERGGTRVSTIDLFAGRWVFFVGPRGDWREAGARVATHSPFEFHLHALGPDGDLRDVENHWSAAYGVESDGAVLIRPDGFIAWRSHSASPDPTSTLQSTLAHLSFRITSTEEPYGASDRHN